jgi:CMP-N,N'-diacetyllegionaminic acid synthase
MIEDKKVLAVVPARGGSKGVPMKNLRPVGGVPLVARVATTVQDVPYFDRAVVSTDHEEIASAAEAAGISAPFRRPEELSGDRIGDWEVLNHAVLATEKIDGHPYDIIVMLQPTAPLRRAADVARTIETLVAEDLDAVWTVTETDLKYHPLKQFSMDTGLLDYFDPAGKSIVARQQLTPVYHVNGVAYAFTRSCLVEQKAKLGRRTKGMIIEGPDISIDTEADFTAIEKHMGNA